MNNTEFRPKPEMPNRDHQDGGCERDYLEGKISLQEFKESLEKDEMTVEEYLACLDAEIPYNDSGDFYRWYLGEDGKFPDEGTDEYEKMEEEHFLWCNERECVASQICSTLNALVLKLKSDGMILSNGM